MRTLSLIIALVFVFVLSADAYTQASRGGISAAGRRVDEFDHQRRKADRDSMDSEMRRKKPSKEELQNAARIKAETKEDLEGLQKAYNDAVAKLSGGQVLEIEYVVAAAEKINKHATRLKANIALPKPEERLQAKPIEVTGDTRKQLRDLCARIYELLTNPMIENSAVLDIEAATSARQLLDGIIDVSERLGKVN